MRVAISGISVLGSWGRSREEFFEKLDSLAKPKQAEKHGNVSCLPDSDGLRSISSRNIPDFDFKSIVGTKNKRTRKMDRISRLVSVCAFTALEDAGIERGGVAPGRGAVITGSHYGALGAILSFHKQMRMDGPDRVNPVDFPPTSHNVAGGHVSIEFGFSGPLLHFASGSLSSHNALLYAFDCIGTGRADCVISGGWELDSIDPDCMEIVCLVVLESEEHLRRRKGRCLAYLHGGASTGGPALNCCDESLEIALKAARWSEETLAIRLPTSGLESLTGPVNGASGAVSTATMVWSLRKSAESEKDSSYKKHRTGRSGPKGAVLGSSSHREAATLLLSI